MQFVASKHALPTPCRCPSCKRRIRYVGDPGDWPAKVECPQCGETLLIEVKVRYTAKVYDRDKHGLASAVMAH